MSFYRSCFCLEVFGGIVVVQVGWDDEFLCLVMVVEQGGGASVF
jgi:hypothetical protein